MEYWRFKCDLEFVKIKINNTGVWRPDLVPREALGLGFLSSTTIISWGHYRRHNPNDLTDPSGECCARVRELVKRARKPRLKKNNTK